MKLAMNTLRMRMVIRKTCLYSMGCTLMPTGTFGLSWMLSFPACGPLAFHQVSLAGAAIIQLLHPKARLQSKTAECDSLFGGRRQAVR